MENAYAAFWRKNTSKVFSVTVLWGLLLGAPAMLVLLAYNKMIVTIINIHVLPALDMQPLTGLINIGDLLEDNIGQRLSYGVTILAFQMGFVGGSILWVPAIFRILFLKWENAFSWGAIALYTLFFGGAQMALICYLKLRVAGMDSDDSPVVWALVMLGVVGMAMTMYLGKKIQKTLPAD